MELIVSDYEMDHPDLILYSIIRPLKYHVIENIIENGAFAPKEQMLHFPYFQNYLKLFIFFNVVKK